MQNLCSSGYLISSVDRKALEHFLLIPIRDWGFSALTGMINKAVKTIRRDYFELYKSKQQDTVSADMSVIIPGILAMNEFKPYNFGVPETPVIDRIEITTEEIWTGGFDVEDFEKQALDAYYSDAEGMLHYFMDNKIYQRRKAFVREKETEMLNDPEVTEIPAKQDDFINMVCALPGYLNRAAATAAL